MRTLLLMFFIAAAVMAQDAASLIQYVTASNSRLPAGYRECNWIATTNGLPYINTGFLFNRSTDDFMIDFSCNLPSYANQNIFGAIVSATNTVGLFARSTGFWTVRWDATRQTTAALSTSRTVVRSNRAAGNACVNGVSCTTITTLSPASTSAVVLFGCRETNNSVTKNPAPMVLYGFEIYRNGGEAMKLVPCLNPSNVPGVYDIVGATFSANSGTGYFSYELK